MTSKKNLKAFETIQSIFFNRKLQKLVLFGIVGGTGVVINTAILFALTSFMDFHYLLAAAIATETAIISNFFGNHLFTFRHDHNDSSLWKKFSFFQSFSLITLIGTLTILFLLTTFFGQTYLLLWNLIAIVLMFLMNFALNQKFTWKNKTKNISPRISRAPQFSKSGKKRKMFLFTIIFLAIIALLPAAQAADLVATSQFGYHPQSEKQVIVYTIDSGATSGTFVIGNRTGQLAEPEDGNGNPTTCQGGIPCLVGSFSEFTTSGTHTITTTVDSESQTTAPFMISDDIYSDNLDVFFEFFDALRQQNSNYHADMHNAQSPSFPIIADGSPIIQTDQAALTTVRLGSAYRRNPEIFTSTTRTYIIDYVDYLLGIKGAHSVEGDGEYRFGWSVSPENVFIPGPTNTTSMDIVDLGGNTVTVDVVSLCGADDNTTKWNSCIDKAQQLYQCMPDEPCLNLSYTGPSGTVEIDENDHTYPAGWMYDWNCFLDARLETGMFNDKTNPCLMFEEERADDMYTLFTLAAFTQAIPATYDDNPEKAVIVYEEAKAIAAEIGDEFTTTNVETLAGPKSMSAQEKYAWAGMSLFLLYDYSGDESYLQRAHSYRDEVRVDGFDSSATFGNEFYWEEYIRHEDAILSTNLEYEIDGDDPRRLLTNKLEFDWENNDDIDISRSGERVFQKMRAEGFSISRSQIIQAVYAMKTTELAREITPSFTQEIADNQLAWLTGQNAVQDGETGKESLRSYSFIFGLGQDNPTRQHTRYLVDTTLSESSDLIGARGIDYRFSHNGSLTWMDGRTQILDQSFGALGNDIGAKIDPWLNSRTYDNGETSIPGWINGAFDTNDGDVILNYHDDKDSYLFTESTNEMVAAAVELFAYMDAEYNNLSRHAPVSFANNTNETTTVIFTVNTEPTNATITLNGSVIGITTDGSLSTNMTTGDYLLRASKQEYETWEENITLTESTTKNITLQQTNNTNETASVIFTINTQPTNVTIALNNTIIGTTTNGTLSTNTTTGDYLLSASKVGYVTWEEIVALTQTMTRNITLQQDNATNETTNNSIIASGTNVPLSTDNNSSAMHHLFEIDTGSFWITQQNTGNTTWLINGVIKARDTQKNSSFNWTPGILSVPITPPDYPNTELFTVTAKTANESVTWTVDVENVINPFFEGDFGSSEADIQVFTNNFASNYSTVSVTLDNSGNRNSYSLNPVITEDETDWKTSVTNLEGGNNWLREITTTDQNNNTETYTFGNVRAHYTTPEDDDDDRRSSGGGGGGGAFATQEDLELVYVRFSRDVLTTSDPQMIVLDAKTTNSEVRRVEAIIQTPKGTALELELSLIEGDDGYGTWSEGFSGFTPGEYHLEEIHLWGREENANKVSVNDSSFYVLAPNQNVSSNLEIIYSTLSPSSLESGMNATLRLDASDSEGVTGVEAIVQTTKNDTFTVQLDQVAGNSQYGTWEGIIEGLHPDTTYTISEITVSNVQTSRSHQVKERSFYVAPSPQSERQGNSITGAVVSASTFSRDALLQMLKAPMIPMIVGFSIMVLILGAAFLSYRVKKQLRSGSEK